MLSAPRRSAQVWPKFSQRGMSLVELLVGVAVGLFIVAGATAVVGSQLGDTRRLVTETQIQQDMRGTLDIIVRELRRAGYSVVGHEYVWGDGAGNSNKNTTPAETPTISSSSSTVFYYDRATNQQGPWGFQLFNGVVQMQMGAGGWQDLTDSRIMTVTAFTVTPRVIETSKIPCAKDCADGTTACWPTVTVREFDVSMTAQSKDGSVVRTVDGTARLRNDRVTYNVTGSPDQVCPL
jgi:prepilin-type N-terminal cleavage/methylation domain-containing protein